MRRAITTGQHVSGCGNFFGGAREVRAAWVARCAAICTGPNGQNPHSLRIIRRPLLAASADARGRATVSRHQTRRRRQRAAPHFCRRVAAAHLRTGQHRNARGNCVAATRPSRPNGPARAANSSGHGCEILLLCAFVCTFRLAPVTGARRPRRSGSFTPFPITRIGPKTFATPDVSTPS